jgi:multidrug efflux pump subunit AcrA (membrane-fusion protein)
VEAQCLPHKSRLAPVAAVGVIESVKTIERRLRAMRHFRFQPWSPARRILTGGLVAFVAAVGILPWRVVAQQDEAREAKDPPAQKEEDGGSARPAAGKAADESAAKDDPKPRNGAARSPASAERDIAERMRRRREEDAAKDAGKVPHPDGIGLEGYLTARTVDIMARSDGVVQDVKLKEGQRVKAGDVLFQIENSKLELQVKAAMVELQATKVTLERLKKLFQVGGAPVSNSEIQEAEAKVETAQANVRLREAELGETSITAPFAGTVAEAKAQPGQYVRAGSPLTTLVESDVLQAVFTSPPVYIPHLQPGTKLKVVLDRTRSTAFDAEVIYVAPQLDPRSQTIRVKANVADPKRRLLPGMTVIALLPQAANDEARAREAEPRSGGGLFGR